MKNKLHHIHLAPIKFEQDRIAHFGDKGNFFKDFGEVDSQNLQHK